VTAGVVTSGNVPTYLVGIGTVQANYTVSVVSRVDGQITQVFFTEGQEVKAGDRLFQIDERPYQAALEQATAAKARDESNLHAAQLDLDRYSSLVTKGFQTRQSYDEQKGTVGADAGNVAADQAQIDAAKLNLVYANIRSPIDGRTGARLVDPGNYVQGGTPTSLVSITQIKPIFVSFTLPQENLDAIRLNQAKGELSVDAYSSDGKTMLSSGKLTLIDNLVNTTTGTIHMKAQFANADERLWPGQFVSVRLILNIRQNVPTVPSQTIMQGPDGAYVYFIKPDQTVDRRDVELSSNEDGVAVISKGLAIGDHVVVTGQYRLSQGAKVNSAASTQSTPAG
jgi:multidrug efflux system membrane fusion protein